MQASQPQSKYLAKEISRRRSVSPGLLQLGLSLRPRLGLVHVRNEVLAKLQAGAGFGGLDLESSWWNGNNRREHIGCHTLPLFG